MTAYADGAMQVWDANTGKELEEELRGENDWIARVA